MLHEYTRQRQGRDFDLDKPINNAATNHRHTDASSKEDDAKKTLHRRLEQYKEQAERVAVPVDGNEPPEKGR